jgi:hypothetical protein
MQRSRGKAGIAFRPYGDRLDQTNYALMGCSIRATVSVIVPYEATVMRALIIGTMLLASSAALAQTPYAGMQSRPIKALSEQQVVDPGAGRGMGLALAAELNGYPGPSHVLELADKLELTADQRASVQSLFNSMKAEALSLSCCFFGWRLANKDRVSIHQNQITPAH